MPEKIINVVFENNGYKNKIDDYQYPLIKWFRNDKKYRLPKNLTSVYISQNEDEMYFIFDFNGQKAKDMEDDIKNFDTVISVFVNFGNYENTPKFRYNIFQVILIADSQKLEDKICRKLKESTNVTRKIILCSNGSSVNEDELPLLPFWFDSQYEPGVFQRESMKELEHIPDFLVKKVEDKHEFSEREIEQVKEWLDV